MSPLPNRVTPFSELISHPGRGLVYGNRGCLHNRNGRVVRFSATTRWIACQLRYKDWHRDPLLQPGRFTELFFLDEVTAFAAGHRPCALCRRADYNALLAHARVAHPEVRGADALDALLHLQRLTSAGERCLHSRPARELADGCFVRVDGEPWLVHEGWLLRWTPAGYDARRPIPRDGDVAVITPPLLASLLAAGWQPLVPLLHPTAHEPTVLELVR